MRLFERRFLILIFCFTSSFASGKDASATLEIEPLADTLPANFLKFYLHFSEPMERETFFATSVL